MSQTKKYAGDVNPADILSLTPGFILRVFMLLYLLGLGITESVTSNSRCTIDEPLCNYRQQHIKNITRLDISSSCHSLDLSYNFLKAVDDFDFHHLTGLLSLDMSHNQINHLGPKAFFSLSNLTCLDLNNNQLSHAAYPRMVFQPLYSLKILDIDQGPDLALSSLSSLEELYMDMHNIEFGPVFAYLGSLEILSADPHRCHIDGLFNDTFKVFENTTVSVLNLRRCHMKTIELMTFSHFHHLERLDIGGNEHLGLPSALNSLAGFRGKHPFSIDISKENSAFSPLSDRSLTKDMFEYLKDICVRSLNLNDNMLVYFDVDGLRMFRHKNCLEEFHFKNFYLEYFILDELFIEMNRFRYLRRIDVTGSLLTETNSHIYEIFSTRAIPPVSDIDTLAIPPLLEFMNVSHVRLNCGKWGRVHSGFYVLGGSQLRMSYVGGTGCSAKIHGLENLEVLNISGNDFSRKLNHFFLDSFPNLTTLVARDTNLDIPFKADTTCLLFRGLARLRHLDLANSGLTIIPKGLLVGNTELLTLDLRYNRFSAIPTAIYTTQSLNQLDMRFNVLSSIRSWDRQQIDIMVRERGDFSLLLNGNPFSCNCETFDFVDWIWTSDIRFDYNGNYSCVLNNRSMASMLNVHAILNDLKIQCISSFWIVFGTLGASVLIVCLLGAAVGYRYRVPIKYWCITLCKKPEAKPEKRHRYDALVAYCHEDYEWVCHTLQPTLEKNENQFGYKLCIYDRDFIPGLTIEENVVNATNNSFKTILVITPAFVRSAWCRFEIQMARMKTIQEGRQDVIIPVILQDVPVSTMPKTLLNLWNTSVFLVWSGNPAEQRHFWDKLISALGPARVLKQVSTQSNGVDENADDVDGNADGDRGIIEVIERHVGERQPLLSRN